MKHYRIYFDDNTSIIRRAKDDSAAVELGLAYLDAIRPAGLCIARLEHLDYDPPRIFKGLSTIAFPQLGLKVQVSRQLQSAFVLSIDHTEAIGVIERKATGQIDWAPVNGRKLPVEILNVVATMI